MRKHMRAICTTAAISLLSAVALSGPGNAAGLCQKYGPQTPRDIASAAGENDRVFALAPSSAELNLCNIHFHKNAEQTAPGLKVFVGADKHGGYKCNECDSLSTAELKAPARDVCSGVKPRRHDLTPLGAHLVPGLARQVTWSVRPSYAEIDINSLASRCKGNVFKEDHAHGVRQLVTAKELLAKIK